MVMLYYLAAFRMSLFLLLSKLSYQPAGNRITTLKFAMKEIIMISVLFCFVVVVVCSFVCFLFCSPQKTFLLMCF